MTGLDAIRAEILAQPEADRVDYALQILAWHLDPLPAWTQGAARLGLVMPRADLRVLHHLDRNRGRFVTANALVAARGIDQPTDAWDDPARAAVAVSTIRRRLTAARLPMAIMTWRGVGYRLDAPAGWRIEDAAAAQAPGAAA